MSEPTYSPFTERMYSRLPEIMRDADAINDYALKHYISAIGDVEDQVERLIARFTYLTKQERLGLDNLEDDYSYYDRPWADFQSTDSRNSAAITTVGLPAHLRTIDAYRVVPNTTIYTGAVFRTNAGTPEVSYGLRVWYYNASMALIATRDLGRNNGSTGPQWVILNTADQVPSEAYYLRVSPFANNTTGSSATVLVDDVYVRSRYEVTTTNNLVSSGHNFTMRAERELIKQGDFDDSWDLSDLTEWSLGDDVTQVEKSLSGVPEIQAYRNWLALNSDTAEQPGYARQVITGVEPSATYTFALLLLRDATIPADASLRVTITPNTGGPTTRTVKVGDYDKGTPSLWTFTWNSPETISTAIVNIEYLTGTTPARGVMINDVSMVRYRPTISQLGRIGDPVTTAVTERTTEDLLASGDYRSSAWIRYATGTDPEEPLEPSVPDPASGTSFIEAQWHPTRPENTYRFSGEITTNDVNAYADLIIWYRTEGKGWGEKMLHRLSTNVLNARARFDRIITIPDSATEFRVNLDVYRSNGSRSFELTGLTMMPMADRHWYAAGSRPFAFNALATRSLNFLSRGDLLHYTADVMVAGTPGYGSYGVRIMAGESQVVHERMVTTTGTDEMVRITGAFQVPESLMELRAVFYVNDPVPKHQAAYFLSDLRIVHSTQQFVEDPQNLLRNGGFEQTPPLGGWMLLSEREEVRRNLVLNPIGPTASGTSGWRTTANDTLTLVQDGGRPAMKLIEPGTGTGLYMDPDKNYTGFPVGSTVRFSADVKVTQDTTQMRLVLSPYNGADRTGGSTGWITQMASDGWVRYKTEAVITASPAGSHFRALVWPADGSFDTGEGFLVRNVMIEVDTDGAYFDRYMESDALVRYSWDSTAQAHVEQRTNYIPPVNLPMSIGTGPGYNLEDVPDRPEDVPLGATSDLVDPRTANTEWLPWLSQFAGHNINHFATLEDARNAFSDTESNFAAGTIGAIQNAVGAVLTGSKTVRVFPMTTDLTKRGEATQWDISIVTRTSESPDVSVMEEAVIKRNAKPAGVVFHFHKHQSTWDAVELDNPTWDAWDRKTWTELEESGLGS